MPSLRFLLSSQQVHLIQEALLLLPPHPNVLSLRDTIKEAVLPGITGQNQSTTEDLPALNFQALENLGKVKKGISFNCWGLSHRHHRHHFDILAIMFRAPYFEMENSPAPPSGSPPQGDSQTHSGYINPASAYHDVSGYYYYHGQPDSQFCPAPMIHRSPYPEASGPPNNPSAYPNPPAEHGNTFGEVRIHSEHDAPQPSGSLSNTTCRISIPFICLIFTLFW
ncbi:hypothetical protein BDN67DRAFT_985108 [Paxillus ammoniavirescens]|nr:hypothetical protein BDN67DRAFT_985108 [Paxillus ammoniavirescens]